MSGTSFPISGKSRQIMRDINPPGQVDKGSQLGLLNPVFALRSKTGLGLLVGNPDTRVETRMLPTGDIRISFVYTLDSDHQANNGRIVMRDEFTLDGADRSFKKHFRNFRYNGEGKDKDAWEKKLAIYKSLRNPNLQKARRFSDAVVRYQGLPISSNPVLKGAIKNPQGKLLEFYRASDDHVAQGGPKQSRYKFKPFFPESHYSMVRRGQEIEITVSMVYDKDTSADNGRIFLRDTYVLDSRTYRLKKISRNWDVDRDSRGKVYAEALAKRLNAKQPSVSEAQAAIAELVPVILPRRSSPSATPSPSRPTPPSPTAPRTTPPPKTPAPPAPPPSISPPAGKPGEIAMKDGGERNPDLSGRSPRVPVRIDPKKGSGKGRAPSTPISGLPKPTVPGSDAPSRKTPPATPPRRTGGGKLVFHYVSGVGASHRNDSVRNIKARVPEHAKPIFERKFKHQSVSIRTNMTIISDNRTGKVRKIIFENINGSGERLTAKQVNEVLKQIADRLASRLSFEKMSLSAAERNTIEWKIPLVYGS